MKNAKSSPKMSLDECELLLDKQLRKLELIDEEDQSSYKIIDYQLRTAETMKSMLDTKLRFEFLRRNTVKHIDSITVNRKDFLTKAKELK